MIKMVALLSKRPGMSREEFIDYYERRHVPLIMEHVPQVGDYRRSYVVPADMDVFALERTAGGAPRPAVPFDVLTEGWFETRAAFDAMCATFADPKVAARIAADEERFLDRAKMIHLLVEERISKIG